jgi:hypothetical protein
MLWGKSIKVFTDHKNLTRDALDSTSDRVYRWRLLSKEYAPEIICIKGIHNTVADAMLQLEYNLKLNTNNEYTHAMLCVSSEEMSTQRWKSFVHHWQWYNECNASTQYHSVPMNVVFANCSMDDKRYHSTTTEIAQA